ncbi:MAG: response regulator transcription factor [Acidobacteriota bacterium]|nr:response regulator transcription factor [Acidobacteriota bacterium]
MSVAPLADSRGQTEHAPSVRPTVLVVDDEVSYRDALDVGLTHEGYRVVTAGSIAEARAAMATTTPQLILLDVMLPDGSGIDLCRELTRDSTVPVIMVSARTSEVDVVLGLEIGAADYVTKPYRLRELVARIRAVLRRPAPANEPDSITFGTVTIDLVRRRVTRGEQVIEMSRKEFDLLALFASHLGDVVTREVCLDTLWWGLDLADSRTLDTHVKRLRQKIEEVPATPRHLVTVRGVGFRLDP